MRSSGLALLAAALPFTLGVPSQPPISNTTKLPTHFGALIFPGFQALDLYGPIDLLNSVALLYGNQTTMKLTVLAETMEPVTNANTPGGFGESTMPTMTYADYLAKGNTSSGLSDIEVLIVPGGGGARKDRTVAEIAFIKELYPKLQYILSVCTGAALLAKAGVLDGKTATTNKRSFAWVKSTGPNTTWVPTARWVVDGNIWTSSGISAGQDLGYAWVSHVYGDEVSSYMSKSLEYERQTDSTYDPFGAIWDVPGAV
jgi:transcriptional regulator GlxA family with amidase domain